jgi:pimeloyl-ACP methyl ester carboxylesterase
MPKVRVNDVSLQYEMVGASGDPVVLVHGSWSDHTGWQQNAADLAQSFRVMTYDRRGHSQSDCPPGQGTRQQDEADLAALLEALDLAPAHVVGNSFGSSVALGLAVTRPDLFRSVIAHEPPLTAIIAEDQEMQPMLGDFQHKVDAVLQRLEAGDIEGGTRQFLDEIAVGPGAWDMFPAERRQRFMNNALTWVDENRDPQWNQLDLTALATLPCPVLLTQGGHSFPWFRPIIAKLRTVVPDARVHTFEDAGHIANATHPEEWAQVTSEFIRAVGEPAST